MGGEGVEILLGRPRILRFRYQDMRLLEERAGKPIGDVVSDLGRLSLRAMEQVLWAGLRHEDPKLTPEAVSGLLQDWFEKGKALPDLVDVIRKAVTESGFFGKTENGGPPP